MNLQGFGWLKSVRSILAAVIALSFLLIIVFQLLGKVEIITGEQVFTIIMAVVSYYFSGKIHSDPNEQDNQSDL